MRHGWTMIAAILCFASTKAIAEQQPETATGLWQALDPEGVFAFNVGTQPPDLPLPPNLGVPTRQAGPNRSIPCRCIDVVDLRQPSPSGFSDDGQSRVLDLPGGRFRVTGAPRGFELKWYSVAVKTADQAGIPHLLVFELANDRERYTTLTLTTPREEPWSPPFHGQEAITVDALQMSQEPLWYEPDVGVCIYTGRELPTAPQTFTGSFIFFPKAARLKLTVSSSGWARSFDPQNGGAVSRVWVFEITAPLVENAPNLVLPPAAPGRRHLGVYSTHPWYFLSHYGIPPHTQTQRQESLQNLCDLLAFCGA